MRFMLPILFALFAQPALALCSGENLFDTLSTEERAMLQAALDADPYSNGNLWMAEKPDSTLYVLGTMHIHAPGMAEIVAQAVPLLQGSDLILFEADREAQKELLSASDLMFIRSGPTMPQLLDEETWAELKAEMGARGIPGFMASQFRPWYLSSLLSMPPCAVEGMTQGEVGLDMLLMDQAAAADRPTASLEPIEAALKAFGATLPMEEQLDALEMALARSQAADASALFATMIRGYIAGEHRAIWELSRIVSLRSPDMPPEEIDAQFAEMEQALLHDRNRAWIGVIAGHAQTHRTLFIAAGAAHLSGPDGVLSLLADEGYTLTRIPLPAE